MITISNINERVPRNVQFVTILSGFGITEIPNGYFKMSSIEIHTNAR